MKNVKRIFSVLLAILMIASLAACAGNTEDPNTDSSAPSTSGNSDVSTGGDVNGGGNSEAADNFVLPDRPVDEMTGKEYTIIQHAAIDTPFGYTQDSQMGVKVADRVAEVAALYGCQIVFSEIPYNDQFPSQIQAMQFAQSGCDMVFASKNAKLRLTLGTGGSESLMTDLLTLDHILNFWDMNKWGSIVAREPMMAGGYFYGVTPALWVDCTPLPYYQVVYNKDLLAAAELPDLQEYWEKEEWDRDTMLDVITSFDPAVDSVWGMTASRTHMVTATFLTTGVDMVIIDKINSDKTVEWSRGIETADVADALQWLKNALTNKLKHFNNGSDDYKTWEAHLAFNEGSCAMAVTRPQDIFGSVVSEGPENFGLITWAGYEPNILSGFLEQVYTIAIPVFAQNAEHSAFLMYDLFEGFDDIQTMDDVISFYRETYFSSDLDVTCLVRPGVKLQYSYWPNGGYGIIGQITNGLMTSSSVSSLISKYANVDDDVIETYMVPNAVAVEAYRQNGFFK